MKRTITLLICVAVLMGIAAASHAEGLMGRNEINGSAAWIKVEDLKLTLAGVNYGRFVTPNVEAQLGVLYLKPSGEDSAYALAPAVSYYFISPSTTTTVPYVGVGYYWISLFGEKENNWEAFAGAKFFLDGNYSTAKTAAFLEYRYLKIASTSINTVWAGLATFF